MYVIHQFNCKLLIDYKYEEQLKVKTRDKNKTTETTCVRYNQNLMSYNSIIIRILNKNYYINCFN